MGHTGPQRQDYGLREQYLSKHHPDNISYARPEDESGHLDPDSKALAMRVRLRRRRCVEELIQVQKAAREASQPSRPARILHIGAGKGELLAELARQVDIEGVALELDPKLGAAAKRRGLKVESEPLESSQRSVEAQLSPGFDLIFEHYLLQHLQQPRAHLKALARRLSDDGLAVIEVPNLCQAAGSLEDDFLRLKQPLVFTPHALATMASHAGLAPVSMIADENLTIVLRKIKREERASLARKIFPGPDAQTVAKAARANDLRLTVKRGLYRIGVRSEMMQLAAQAYEKCLWIPSKADIAVEIAAALDRVGQREQAIQWLQKSLEHRPDVQIENLIQELQSAQRNAPRVPFFAAPKSNPWPDPMSPSERWSLRSTPSSHGPN